MKVHIAKRHGANKPKRTTVTMAALRKAAGPGIKINVVESLSREGVYVASAMHEYQCISYQWVSGRQNAMRMLLAALKEMLR